MTQSKFNFGNEDAHLDPPDETYHTECTHCTEIYLPEDKETFESGDIAICKYSIEGFKDSIMLKVDMQETLTEDEVLFLSWYEKHHE